MPIAEPESVRFSDLHIRTLANRLSQTTFAAKVLIAEWTANGGVALIPNTSEVITDGSNKPITGIEANNIVNRAAEFIAFMETGGKLDTVLQVSTNST